MEGVIIDLLNAKWNSFVKTRCCTNLKLNVPYDKSLRRSGNLMFESLCWIAIWQLDDWKLVLNLKDNYTTFYDFIFKSFPWFLFQVQPPAAGLLHLLSNLPVQLRPPPVHGPEQRREKPVGRQKVPARLPPQPDHGLPLVGHHHDGARLDRRSGGARHRQGSRLVRVHNVRLRVRRLDRRHDFRWTVRQQLRGSWCVWRGRRGDTWWREENGEERCWKGGQLGEGNKLMWTAP